MDSSIWVATMVTLPSSRAMEMTSRCTDGISLQVQLHAQIAARHHDAFGGFGDVAQVIHRLGAFDLGDDGDADVPGRP